MTVVLDHPHREGFKGLNDLTFASNGDLYFTDQGQSALEDPSGRVYRLRAGGELDLLFKGLEGPNGLVLNRQENILYVAVTRTNRIISIPLRPSYKGISKAGIFIQLSGSPTGPDGMALDEDGNLVIVHAGFGTVWVFSALGEPLYRIKSCAGMRTTNVAYGGPRSQDAVHHRGRAGRDSQSHAADPRPHHVRARIVLKSPLDVLNLYPAHDHTLNGVLSTRRSSRGREPFLLSAGTSLTWDRVRSRDPHD